MLLGGGDRRGRFAVGGAVVLGVVLPEVDDGQEQDHGDEQQRGHGVDLRADALFRHAVDGHGQRGGGRARGEVADDEVVDGHGEGRQRAGDDAGLDLGDDDLPERLHPGAAQILGRVDEVAVHLPQLRADGQQDVGDIEADVGDEQRAEAQGQPLRQRHQGLPAVDPAGERAPAVEEHHEQQTQADAGDDVRVHHGDVVDGHQRLPGLAAHGVEADGSKRAGHGGDDGGQQGHQQRGIDAVHDEPVLQQLGVPVEGEALPHAGAVAGVEGEHDEDDDGRIEEQAHQDHQNAVADGVAFSLSHSITACSSPSPKRFMTSIQITTTTIITREMAAPSWGLYAPPRN